MSKPDEFSGAHFEWLVEGRSRNQKSTLALYKLVEAHENIISRNLVLHLQATTLTAVAFSLWRAVFLSDLTGFPGDQLTDLKRFLQSLLAHNSILYQTDYTTREWTFEYYLENALFRLRQVRDLGIAPAIGAVQIDGTLPKESWSNAQAALDSTISSFAEALRDHDQD